MFFNDLEIEKMPTKELKERLNSYQNRGSSFIVGFFLSVPMMAIAFFMHPFIGLVGMFSSTVLGIITVMAMLWIFAAKEELRRRRTRGEKA